MAYIVINSQFKPFSYDEMIKPVETLNKAHIENMNNNTKLAESATSVGELLDQEKDKELYQLYLNYKLNLSDLASVMATLGSTPDTIRDINNLRTSYHKEIEPIKVGYDNFMKFRDELNKEKQAARTRDDHVIFEKDASNLSTTDFVNNPALTSAMVSGNAVYKNAFNQASLIRKELIHNPGKYKGILSYGGIPAAYQRFVTYGATSGEVSNAVNEYKRLAQNYNSELMEQAIMNDKNANPLLMLMMNRAVMDSGILNWDNENINKDEAFNLAVNKAGEGLFGAVGTSTPDTVNNPFASTILSHSYASKPDDPDIPDSPWTSSANTKPDGETDTTALNEDKKTILNYLNSKNMNYKDKKLYAELMRDLAEKRSNLNYLVVHNRLSTFKDMKDTRYEKTQVQDAERKLKDFMKDKGITGLEEMELKYPNMTYEGMVDYIDKKIASASLLTHRHIMRTTDNDAYTGYILNHAMSNPEIYTKRCDKDGNVIGDTTLSDVLTLSSLKNKNTIINEDNKAIYIKGEIGEGNKAKIVYYRIDPRVIPFDVVNSLTGATVYDVFTDYVDNKKKYREEWGADKYNNNMTAVIGNIEGTLINRAKRTPQVIGVTNDKAAKGSDSFYNPLR